MNKDSALNPQKLGNKLLQIRSHLKLSQSEMLVKLGLHERLYRSNISQYERGDREPSLLVLLKYARAVNITVDTLIDDEINLYL